MAEKADKVPKELPKEQSRLQKSVKEMDAIQKEFGGRKPELITMYYGYQLNSLTKTLVILTSILAGLIIANIILLIVMVFTG